MGLSASSSTYQDYVTTYEIVGEEHMQHKDYVTTYEIVGEEHMQHKVGGQLAALKLRRRRARAGGQPGSLSTALIPLSFPGQVLFALNQTLLQHESVRAGSLQAPYTTEDLIKHYNCGDLNAVIFNHDTSQLPNFINTTLPPHEQVTAQEIDSYFRQELIYKRNERMGKRVMALLQENEDKICFFAFGAGHFLGNNTVIDVLRQAGLEVDHTPAGQDIHSPAAWSPVPPPEGTSTSPAPVTPAAAVPTVPSAPPTAPPEEEDPALSPHLLLPDSLSQLEEFGRQKKWHKRQNKHQRPRQFNDLWVRIEDSTTASSPLPPLQPTHISGTATPPFQISDQLQQQDLPGPTSSSAPRCSYPTLGLLSVVAATIAAPFLLHTLGPS
ncbi:PREDICTED: metalloprotease TIKI2-like [Galeopterus variegatus]|uniref:Metalloprotease TIKI n=1 Tax=Galeopterus variegatus TaxID=482537 RepID=A0ABM0SDR4_GALVR|nr:PREDICTED: metalloprotease TIKI2-like [Galeopterus variegatus]